MDAMSAHRIRPRLSAWGWMWLGVAVAFAVAGMVTGLWFSFWNLRDAAAAHGWTTPALLPLMIDLGIPTYVIIDHLIVVLGWRSVLARTAAWGFALLTIVLNGAVTPATSLLWRITAAAMPAAWVLGIEVLRLIWRALRKDLSARPDRIPLGRWIASPLPTVLLWRRKHLLGIASWQVLCAMEDARTWLWDTIDAIREQDPEKAIPASVLTAARTGRLPGEVADAVRGGKASEWEPVMGEWVAHRLGLPDTLRDALALGRQMPSAEPPADAVRVAVPEPPQMPSDAPSRKASAGAKRKASAGAARKPSDDDLLDDIRAMGQGVSKYRVMNDLGVGEPRARRLLDRLATERPLRAVAK